MASGQSSESEQLRATFPGGSCLLTSGFFTPLHQFMSSIAHTHTPTPTHPVKSPPPFPGASSYLYWGELVLRGLYPVSAQGLLVTPIPFQMDDREGKPKQRQRVSTHPSAVYRQVGFWMKCAAQLPFHLQTTHFKLKCQGLLDFTTYYISCIHNPREQWF